MLDVFSVKWKVVIDTAVEFCVVQQTKGLFVLKAWILWESDLKYLKKSYSVHRINVIVIAVWFPNTFRMYFLNVFFILPLNWWYSIAIIKTIKQYT